MMILMLEFCFNLFLKCSYMFYFLYCNVGKILQVLTLNINASQELPLYLYLKYRFSLNIV